MNDETTNTNPLMSDTPLAVWVDHNTMCVSLEKRSEDDYKAWMTHIFTLRNGNKVRYLIGAKSFHMPIVAVEELRCKADEGTVRVARVADIICLLQDDTGKIHGGGFGEDLDVIHIEHVRGELP